LSSEREEWLKSRARSPAVGREVHSHGGCWRDRTLASWTPGSLGGGCPPSEPDRKGVTVHVQGGFLPGPVHPDDDRCPADGRSHERQLEDASLRSAGESRWPGWRHLAGDGPPPPRRPGGAERPRGPRGPRGDESNGRQATHATPDRPSERGPAREGAAQAAARQPQGEGPALVPGVDGRQHQLEIGGRIHG
jgi:hypothetical protein